MWKLQTLLMFSGLLFLILLSGCPGIEPDSSKQGVSECKKDSDCGDGEKSICRNNVCEKKTPSDECKSDADCPVKTGEQLECKENKCIKKACSGLACNKSCIDDDDCSSGQKCKKKICREPHWVTLMNTAAVGSGSSMTTSKGDYAFAGWFKGALHLTMTTGAKKTVENKDTAHRKGFLALQRKDGRFEWMKTFPKGFHSPLVSINAKDEFCVVGSLTGDVTVKTSQGTTSLKRLGKERGSGFFVLKLDSKGEIVWAKSLGDTFSTIVSSTVSQMDGGCVVVGSHMGDGWKLKTKSGELLLQSPSGYSSGFVLSFDSKGYVEWGHPLGSREKEILYSGSFGSAVGIDGSISVLLKGPTVVRFSASGKMLWKKKLQFIRDGKPSPDYVYRTEMNSDLVVNKKGELYFGVKTFDASLMSGIKVQTKAGDATFDKDGYLVFKLSKDGEPLWARLIKGELALVRLKLNKNDNLFLAGKASQFLEKPAHPTNWQIQGTAPFIARLSSQGELMWTQVLLVEYGYAVSTASLFTGFATSTSGDVFLTGSFERGNLRVGSLTLKTEHKYQHFFTLKMGADGSLP